MGTEVYSRYTSGGEGSSSGPVDCVGASKGLFCGLLLLVAALICHILYFVLVSREQLKLLAICLADGAHGVLLVISFLATLIGFCRVRKLRFHGDHGSPLRDILLRVSILGVFAYVLFSLIAGVFLGLNLDIPSLLVAGVAGMVVLQVRIATISGIYKLYMCQVIILPFYCVCRSFFKCYSSLMLVEGEFTFLNIHVPNLVDKL